MGPPVNSANVHPSDAVLIYLHRLWKWVLMTCDVSRCMLRHLMPCFNRQIQGCLRPLKTCCSVCLMSILVPFFSDCCCLCPLWNQKSILTLNIEFNLTKILLLKFCCLKQWLKTLAFYISMCFSGFVQTLFLWKDITFHVNKCVIKYELRKTIRDCEPLLRLNSPPNMLITV